MLPFPDTVLDNLVTAVDGASFMRELQTLESLRNRGGMQTQRISELLLIYYATKLNLQMLSF